MRERDAATEIRGVIKYAAKAVEMFRDRGGVWGSSCRLANGGDAGNIRYLRMVKTSPHVYLIQIRTKDCPSDKTLREHLAKNDAAAGQQRPLPGSSEIEGGAFRARLGSGNKLRHTTVGLHINGYTERQSHEASRRACSFGQAWWVDGR